MEKSKISIFLDRLLDRPDIQDANIEVINDEILNGDILFSNKTIKILTIIGAIISAVFFFLFLGIAGFLSSEIGQLIIGIVSFIAAIFLFNSNKGLFWETIGVMVSMVAHTSIFTSLLGMNLNISLIHLIFIGISIALIIFADNFIQKMSSIIIIIVGTTIWLYDLHLWGMIPSYSGLVAVALTYYTFKESVFISGSIFNNISFAPIRLGLSLSFVVLIGLGAVNWMFFNVETYYIPYVGSIFILGSLGYILIQIFKKFNIQKGELYTIGMLLLLLPLINNPGIIGSIFLLILGFYSGYKIDFSLGLIGLIYFISRFYYDLDYDLLTKSYIMMGTGLLFLIAYGVFLRLESRTKMIKS